jgi:NADH-quinone oxidoreductase subunit N
MLKYNSNYQNIENMNNYELFEPFMILNNIYNIIYIGRNNFNYSQLIFSDINFILNKHFIILLPEIFSIFSLFLLVILIVFYYIKVSNLSIIDINFSILLINLFTFYFYLQIFSYKTLFAFNFLFIVDFYSIFNKLILLFSTNIILLLILIISIFNKKIFAHNRYEYTIIIGFSTIASSLLISSFDLILLYLALECLSFCLYILVLFKIKNKLSAEAGVKYFCLGSLASGFVLFGISLIYANICSTNFLIIKYWFKLNNSNNEFQLLSIYIGVIFIMFGFLFKLAVFPFHMGLLDIYDGSTLSVTIYLITVIKFVIVIVFCKLFIYVFYAIQII